MTDLSHEQAREQIARRAVLGRTVTDGANAALSVLWPVVESLRADLAHAHAVIARHVEPLRKPCRPEAGDCCDGFAHTWQPAQGSRLPDRVDGNRPSGALCGDLTVEGRGSGVSGRVDETGGSE